MILASVVSRGGVIGRNENGRCLRMMNPKTHRDQDAVVVRCEVTGLEGPPAFVKEDSSFAGGEGVTPWSRYDYEKEYGDAIGRAVDNARSVGFRTAYAPMFTPYSFLSSENYVKRPTTVEYGSPPPLNDGCPAIWLHPSVTLERLAVYVKQRNAEVRENAEHAGAMERALTQSVSGKLFAGISNAQATAPFREAAKVNAAAEAQRAGQSRIVALTPRRDSMRAR